MSIELENEVLLEEFKRDSKYAAYNPVIGKINGEIVLVWIRIENDMESLIICNRKGKRTVFSNKYIMNPVICSNHIVFSACQEDGSWPLFAISIDNNGYVQSKRISGTKGRIMSIRTENQADGSNSWIVYECRIGKKVRVFAAHFDKYKWISDIPVTKPDYNAYDPHIARSEDGFVYIVYTAFLHGNYHIMLQKMSMDYKPIGDPLRISDQTGICLYPSIAPRKGGGVWLCWNSYTHMRRYLDHESYLNHYKYLARRALFWYLPVVYAGKYENDTLFLPINKGAGYLLREPFIVENSVAAKNPVIFQMSNGTVHIIYRKYDSRMCAHKTPDISITTLTENGWTEPEVIVPCGLYEDFTSILLADDKIHAAITKNNRNSGWNNDAEWLDTKNTIQLGMVAIKPLVKTGEHIDFDSYTVFRSPNPSIKENPYKKLDRKRDAKLIWGQTHAHTENSVCIRLNDQSIDMNYRFCQDVQNCDFGTSTDHEYNQWYLEEHIAHKKADYYYFPGEFIAFPAYEWTGTGPLCESEMGHLNPLYLEEEGKMKFYTPHDRNSEGSNINKLWEKYKGYRIITVPHHVACPLQGYDWKYYNEKMLPVVEIFQDYRGQQEQPGAPGSTISKYNESKKGWVLDALKRGYKIGFIGGGDHMGMALGGAEVESLTRRGLYEAFVNRRTFASTGSSGDILFTCNGNTVGSTVKCHNAEFELMLSMNEKITVIHILRNGMMETELRPCKKRFEHDWVTECKEDGEFWYCRIVLDNGEVFWTSPIWLEKIKP